MSTLTITTIQPDLQWEDRTANLQRLEEKIMGIKDPTELVILPEMFSTGFSMAPETLAETMQGPTMDWMKKVAAAKRIILTGSLIIEEAGHFFNRLIWMLPTGHYGSYDKRHLFAYAGENEHYTGGSKRLIASVKGWKINLQVCYDLRFPVWSRQTPHHPVEPDNSLDPEPGSRLLNEPPYDSPAFDGPDDQGSSPGGKASAGTQPYSANAVIPPPEFDILVYVANWPEKRSHAWKTLLQARAIENQCFVLGVNRVGNDGNNIYHSGDSMIVDPQGEVLYQAPPQEDVYTITLQKEKLDQVRERFPFWRDGDLFSIEP